MIGNTIFIAEVKTKSPFGFQAQKLWDELFEIANNHGDWISIHTDQRWGGSFELLARARALTKKPLLAKGIHEHDDDIYRAFDCGADYVLVVGRVPNFLNSKIIIEPTNLASLHEVPRSSRALWNSRDLSTGGFKKETFAQARGVFDGWLVQASNIRSVADIEKDANAILVGTHLEEFIKSLS